MLTAQQLDLAAVNMVETQLRPRGIHDERVLDAMRRVPRHEFVPEDLIDAAYEDRPLAIGDRETISQPYMVAAVTQAARVKAGDKVLEIGGGSGYQAAVLVQLGATVCAIERNPRLADSARERLARLHYQTVEVFTGDGSEGLPDHAPFDVIIVSAGAPHVSPAMLDQLAEGGRMMVPVGNLQQQQLHLLSKRDGQITTERLDHCLFVPLIGKGGWPGELSSSS